MSAGRKRCTGPCGEEKPLPDFYVNGRRNGATYYKSRCKDCWNEYQRNKAASDPEFRERKRIASQEWYAANREQHLENVRVYQSANRERVNTLNRAWTAANPDKAREAKRNWETRNPDAVSRKRHKRRAREAGAHHSPYSRTQIMARWSGCAYCDEPATALDHVTPIAKGGADAEWNLVPACTSCNSSKGAKTLAEWAATF
ncbi:HNH endonuclease [Streptomyces mirabilis]|uniref:HNH endonuclease n=1 Tax=Streptomyces mirabilis TaxID=68239 RepID=UPI0036DD43C7